MSLPRIATIVVVVLVAASVVLRATLILTGWPESSLISDDAFYYFTIAHNIAAGEGATFDGLAATNGFHPLWQLILVPVFASPADIWIPVRVALILALVLDIATGYILYRLVRCWSSTGAWLATTLWFLSPFTLAIGMQGMESSVSALAVVLLLREVTLLVRRSGAPTLGESLRMGVWIGVCGLARTDNLVSVGLAITLSVLATNPSRWAGLKSRVMWIVTTAAAAVTVMLPWFLWNLVQFGTLVQTSGQIKFRNPKIWGAVPWDWSEPLRTFAHVTFGWIIQPSILLTREAFTRTYLYLWMSWGLAAVLIFALVWASVRTWRARPQLRGVLVFLASYLIIHIAFFGYLWRVYASWYALAVWAVVCAWIGLTLPAWRTATRPLRMLGVTSALAIAIAFGVYYSTYLTRGEHGARGYEARWLNIFGQVRNVVKDDVVLGAWDAGVGGYVATQYPGITVTNLDGLVNNQVLEAVREDRYMEYLLETVTMFVQDPGRARMYLSAEEVEQLRQRLGRPPEN